MILYRRFLRLKIHRVEIPRLIRKRAKKLVNTEIIIPPSVPKPKPKPKPRPKPKPTSIDTKAREDFHRTMTDRED
jgi:hypothetical protein